MPRGHQRRNNTCWGSRVGSRGREHVVDVTLAAIVEGGPCSCCARVYLFAACSSRHRICFSSTGTSRGENRVNTVRRRRVRAANSFVIGALALRIYKRPAMLRRSCNDGRACGGSFGGWVSFQVSTCAPFICIGCHFTGAYIKHPALLLKKRKKKDVFIVFGFRIYKYTISLRNAFALIDPFKYSVISDGSKGSFTFDKLRS